MNMTRPVGIERKVPGAGNRLARLVPGPLVALAIGLSAAGVVAKASETLQYGYDTVQRLTRVTHGDGTTIDYVYDALGNRLMKTTTLPGAPSNQPPAAVTNPSIANGVTNVPTTATLSWSPAVDPNSGDSVVYFIYFGTSPTPPLAFSGWTTNWSPVRLRGLTTYYWQVVARDSHNAQTASPVWSFTTGNDPPVADFSATPTNGWPPLTVTFSDRSSSSDDAIVAWEWDINNDGRVDSTNQNPIQLYSKTGQKSVRLTVRDEHGATATIVKTNFLTVYGGNVLDLSPLSLHVEAATSFRHLVVKYSMTNMGDLTVSNQWHYADAFYLSTNAVPGPDAQPLSFFFEDQFLFPGTVYSRTNLLAIPDGPASQQHLVLRADALDYIQETSESNNMLSIPLFASLPDMTVGEVVVEPPKVGEQKATITYSITNVGSLSFDGELYDAVYISTNSVFGSEAISLLRTRFEGTIVSGQGYRRTNTVLLPPLWPPGNCYLLLRADDDNGVVETVETNNLVVVPLVVPEPRAPRIVSQPLGKVGVLRNTTTFSVVAFGEAPLIYYWHKDGGLVAAGAEPTLTLNNLLWSDAGGYSVVVSNAHGAATSQTAFLQVSPIATWGAGKTNSGTSPDYGQAIVPAGLSNVVAVAGGVAHSLALRSDGTVVAWGANWSGQLNSPIGLTRLGGLDPGGKNLSDASA